MSKRILIVDDEAFFVRYMYQLLNNRVNDVDSCSNGEEALSMIASNEYDAITLDYQMPGINGMEVYQKIRETNKTVPVIFVSGNIEFDHSIDRLKMRDPKVDHLSKPFDEYDFVKKIDKWLK